MIGIVFCHVRWNTLKTARNMAWLEIIYFMYVLICNCWSVRSQGGGHPLPDDRSRLGGTPSTDPLTGECCSKTQCYEKYVSPEHGATRIMCPAYCCIVLVLLAVVLQNCYCELKVHELQFTIKMHIWSWSRTEGTQTMSRISQTSQWAPAFLKEYNHEKRRNQASFQ